MCTIIHEAIKWEKVINDTVLEAAALLVTTNNAALACIFDVKCRCKKHPVNLEPLQVKQEET